MSLPAREHFPLLPSWTPSILYLALSITIALLLLGLRYKLGLYGIGWPQASRELVLALRRGWREFIKDHLLQARALERPSGYWHLLAYLGALALLVGTILVFLDYRLEALGLRLLRGSYYLAFEALLDAFGLLFLLGALLLLSKRYLLLRTRSMSGSLGQLLVLVGLVFLALSGFLLEGLRIALKPTPWSWASFVGGPLAGAMAPFSKEILLPLYQLLWWSHALVALGLIASLPVNSLGHIVLGWLNALLRKGEGMGRLSTPFKLQDLMERGEFDVRVGLVSTLDLGSRGRLGLDACIDCGRCEEACPANMAGRPLSPRLLVQRLRDRVREARSLGKGLEVLPALGPKGEEAVWSCTACSACVASCPFSIDALGYIVELRRGLVAQGRLDDRKASILRSIDEHQNPFGLPHSKRWDWMEGEGLPTLEEGCEAEYLYWVGCQSSYDPRCRSIVRAMAQLMREAGVSFAILKDEVCCGEPVRRLGEEGRFQLLALKNIEVLKERGVKRIVTHCAHCYNTLKNEYAELGGRFEVLHHTQLLARLLEEGRIKLEGEARALELGREGREMRPIITYQDPCNLARINGVVEEPRRLLALVGEVREMKRRGVKGLCCGGGGANPWYSVRERERISSIRLREALETGAEMMAVACPFCLVMLEDASRSLGDRLAVMDISELLILMRR